MTQVGGGCAFSGFVLHDLTLGMEEEQGTELGPHEMRITRGGKMEHWVKVALDFFEKNEKRPLTLHTLPPKLSNEKPSENEEGEHSSGRLSNSTITVPRLISVVEIIKREYLKKLETSCSTRLIGLYQYNEIGSLDVPENEESDPAMLALALEGKNHLKMKKIPFMRITLCREPLPDLRNETISYQPPATRQLSRSAKARARKRKLREIKEGAESADGGG